MPEEVTRSRSPPAARRNGSESTVATDELRVSGLNGNFGALVHTPLSAERILSDLSGLGAQLVKAWKEYGGVLVMRGLLDITAAQLVELSALFGEVEDELDDSKKKYAVEGEKRVMRVGNTRDPATRELTALCANDPPLPEGGSPQYRPEERKPIWHTDSTYRKRPPVGSLLYCKQAPPEGGATCFSDTTAAYQALDSKTQEKLKGLECLCSQAHHDAKVHLTSPNFPVLTPEQRAASPAQRVPMVLQHPLTGQCGLYGMNSSTCRVMPKGADITEEELDSYELDAFEHPSVKEEWRSLLPFVTSTRFTIKWEWQAGDLLVWDNRCTMHCATGFDRDRYTREMWRTTIAADLP